MSIDPVVLYDKRQFVCYRLMIWDGFLTAGIWVSSIADFAAASK
jgi:hypothetical protein